MTTSIEERTENLLANGWSVDDIKRRLCDEYFSDEISEEEIEEIIDYVSA